MYENYIIRCDFFFHSNLSTVNLIQIGKSHGKPVLYEGRVKYPSVWVKWSCYLFVSERKHHSLLNTELHKINDIGVLYIDKEHTPPLKTYFLLYQNDVME